MLKLTLALPLMASLAIANVSLTTQGNVVYHIDGKPSTSKMADEGSLIEYISGDGKISLKDDVSNKKLTLNKTGDQYTASKSSSILSLAGIKAYFAKVEVENKNAFTRGDSNCAAFDAKKETLKLAPSISSILYYRDGELVDEYKVQDQNIISSNNSKVSYKSGDIMRFLDRDEYDIYCLEVK